MDKVFRLHFIDGATMAFNRRGILVGCTDNEGNVEDHEGYSLGNGCPDIHGIWYDDEKCTIPWDEVVDYVNTDFHLTGCMYIDNGQVTDEGLIIRIEIDGIVKWDTNNGGADYSGFTGNNNVYCEGCEQQYEVHGVNILICCHCGSEDIHVKEDTSQIQSEMARGYSNYIRRTAPWIIGGDE